MLFVQALTSNVLCVHRSGAQHLGHCMFGPERDEPLAVASVVTRVSFVFAACVSGV